MFKKMPGILFEYVIQKMVGRHSKLCGGSVAIRRGGKQRRLSRPLQVIRIRRRSGRRQLEQGHLSRVQVADPTGAGENPRQKHVRAVDKYYIMHMQIIQTNHLVRLYVVCDKNSSRYKFKNVLTN